MTWRDVTNCRNQRQNPCLAGWDLIWSFTTGSAETLADASGSSRRNLSNNKLRDLREGAFDGAAGVLELLLTGNKLTALQGRMFRGLSGLKTL